MSNPMVSITSIDKRTRTERFTRTIPLKEWYSRKTDDQVRRLTGDVQALKGPVTVLGSDNEIYRVNLAKEE